MDTDETPYNTDPTVVTNEDGTIVYSQRLSRVQIQTIVDSVP